MKLERAYYGLRPVQPYLGTKPIGGGGDPYTSEFDFSIPSDGYTLYIAYVSPGRDVQKTFMADWGDGSENEDLPTHNAEYRIPHVYSSAGEYTVRIIGEDGISWVPGNTFYTFVGNIPGTTDTTLRAARLGLGARFDSIYQYGAFQRCSRLEHVTIPFGMAFLGNQTFAGCTGLTGIVIPGSVTEIGTSTFAGSGLVDVSIPESVNTIGDSAFENCSGLVSIEIPDSVTTLGGGAFAGCSNLEQVVLSSGITMLNYGVFIRCGLTEVNIPSTIVSIGQSAFNACSRLQDIIIPNGVQTIGGYAFANCTGLLRISLPESLQSIDNQAFASDSRVSVITCEAIIPPSISRGSFEGVSSRCPIYVPAASVNAYKTAQYWSARAEYIQAKPTT